MAKLFDQFLLPETSNRLLPRQMEFEFHQISKLQVAKQVKPVVADLEILEVMTPVVALGI